MHQIMQQVATAVSSTSHCTMLSSHDIMMDSKRKEKCKHNSIGKNVSSQYSNAGGPAFNLTYKIFFLYKRL